MFGYDFLNKSKVNNVFLMLRHASLWLMSKASVLQNPNFVAPDTNTELSKGIPIYCVHGFFDRPASCSLVADRILPNLPSAISAVHLLAFDHRWYGESIEYFAEQLKNQIVANKDKHVILMGHSRGGLVVAYMAEYLAKEAGIQVDAVIAIAAPFQGIYMAMWPFTSISASVSEMQLDSPFLEALSQKIDQSTTQYYYFASTADPLVSVESSFRGQHNFSPVVYDQGDEVSILHPSFPMGKQEDNPPLVLLDFHDHLSIMSSHRMVKYIDGFIKDIVNRLLPENKNKDELHNSPSNWENDHFGSFRF